MDAATMSALGAAGMQAPGMAAIPGMAALESMAASVWGDQGSMAKIAGPKCTVQAVCMLHNKARTMSCLMEQADGTIICKATHECKVVPETTNNKNKYDPKANTQPYKKRSLCSFWVEGHCSKGEYCSYAHGEHE